MKKIKIPRVITLRRVHMHPIFQDVFDVLGVERRAIRVEVDNEVELRHDGVHFDLEEWVVKAALEASRRRWKRVTIFSQKYETTITGVLSQLMYVAYLTNGKHRIPFNLAKESIWRENDTVYDDDYLPIGEYSEDYFTVQPYREPMPPLTLTFVEKVAPSIRGFLQEWTREVHKNKAIVDVHSYAQTAWASHQSGLSLEKTTDPITMEVTFSPAPESALNNPALDLAALEHHIENKDKPH